MHHFNGFSNQMAIIKRLKQTGLGEHFGVLQPDGSVFHTTQELGPHVVTFDGFAAGLPVNVVSPIPSHEQWAVMSRINNELYKREQYDLLSNNCEVLANRVAGKPAESRQVAFWALMLAFGGLLALRAAQ